MPIVTVAIEFITQFKPFGESELGFAIDSWGPLLGRIGLLLVLSPLRTVRDTYRVTRLKPYFKPSTWCCVPACDTLSAGASGFLCRLVHLLPLVLCGGFRFLHR